jgi:hypothetical protein
MHALVRLTATVFATCLLASVASALPGPVDYNPVSKVVQGVQPLTASYTLTITTPTTVTTAGTINLVFSVLSQPTTVSAADALTFISAAPSTLAYAGPGQRVTTTITIAVPAGSFAGDYAWKIKTSGWPTSAAVLDNGAAVNATVSPPLPPNNPPPAVNIASPVDGATLTYVQGGTPVSFPISFSASVAAGGQPIDSLAATFAGVPLSVTTTGVGTLTATGSATSPAITTAGTYTIRVAATNRSNTSYATVDVNVIVTAPPPPPPFCADLQWLPPISLNKTIEGGSTMPIKFTLSCAATNQKFVRDTALVIAIYEIGDGGTASTPTLYSYGTGSPNPPDYAIAGQHYQLNFSTAKGTHRYRIEVYHPIAGGAPLLLGTKELNTAGKGADPEDDDDHGDDQHDDGHHD